MSCIKGNHVDKSHGYSTCYYKGKHVRQHRLAYCLANGLELDDIKGKVIRHTCDNRYCVNPEHLVIGTHKDNMRDMTDRNRQAKGAVIASSKLTEEQVLYIRKHYKYRSKDNNIYTLAKMFDVKPTAIHAVLTGTNWAHLGGATSTVQSG